MKPTRGEIRRVVNTSVAFAQFTPSPKLWPGEFIQAFASPTPIIDPMSVCELEAGKPRYQVPTFQTMAEISKAKTMANPAPEPTFSTNSTGSSASIEKATAPLETRTPIKFQRPDQITATTGGSE